MGVLRRLALLGVEKGVVEGFQMGKESISLSHIQFTDDSIFLCLGQKNFLRNFNGFFNPFLN